MTTRAGYTRRAHNRGTVLAPRGLAPHVGDRTGRGPLDHAGGLPGRTHSNSTGRYSMGLYGRVARNVYASRGSSPRPTLWRWTASKCTSLGD